MASVPLGQVNAPQPGPALLAAVRDQGSASHSYTSSPQLLSGPSAARNLADAIHFLCALHGRHPGVIELVAMRTVEPGARAWLSETAQAFARERGYLASLAVQAGPVPATPGVGSEAAVSMQRNAVMTLAQSERRGCAIGAALAVAADWTVVRQVLDCAAVRFGMNAPAPWRAGEAAAVEAVLDGLGDNVGVGRAALFGAEQVAIQHRGLWDLLAARAEARSA
jgi:hypothetical protein